MEYIGLNLTMVHGVNSQMAVDGFHELSFIMTPFMVSERTRQFGQQAFMGVPGPKLPLPTLLIWLTGMDQNLEVSNIKMGGKMILWSTDNAPIPSIFIITSGHH